MSYTTTNGQTLNDIAQATGSDVNSLLAANADSSGKSYLSSTGTYGAGVNINTPSVVSNYNTQSKVNDITNTYQNHANTAIPSFPTGTPAGWDAQTYANFKAANPGIEPNVQDTQMMNSAYQTFDPNAATNTSFGTSFTAPQGAQVQPDGTYLFNGQYYTKDQLASPENVAAIQNAGLQKKKYDTALQTQLDAINKQYDNYRQQQERITQSGAAGAQNALLQSGQGGRGSVAQYAAASADARVNSILSDGQQKLNELDNQRQQLLSQAQLAYEDKNYNLLSNLNTEIETNRKAMLAVAQKKNDEIAAETKAAQKSTAIASAYETAGADVNSILTTLKSQGVTNINAKDVSDFLKESGTDDIQKIAADAAKNGATYSQIHEISQARTPTEASALVAKYGLGESALDTAYKKAQIAKINNDIQTSGAASALGDQALAYAQQYAATGQIPTGLPKGTFGVVSQVAKELPKQKGEIVSAATGVHPAQDTTYADALSSLASAIQLTQRLKELDDKRIGGVISGLANTVGISGAIGLNGEQNYDDLRTQITDLLARARSGAAINDTELRTYEAMLPGTYSEPFGLGTDSQQRINNFQNALTNDLTQKASAKGWSIYGFSKVKINGQDYTVGDIIDNGNQKGRVNPDGTITIIDSGKQSFNSVGGDTNQASKPVANIQIPKDTLAAANNNPGNLRFAGQPGATQGKGGFAMFHSAEEGFNALVNQIKLDASRGLTLAKFIAKYAPPSENDTNTYVKQIAQATSTDPNTKISQIDINKLAKAIAFKESGTQLL